MTGYLTVPEAALLAECSETTIRRAIRDGLLKAVRRPGAKRHNTRAWYMRLEWIERWSKAETVNLAEKAGEDITADETLLYEEPDTWEGIIPKRPAE